MNFVSRKHFNIFLSNLTYLGQGGQGICYLNTKNKMVYKVFNEYFEHEKTGYTEYEILRFKNIRNKTFLWPTDIIYVDEKLVGYILPYKKAKNLYQINPLAVNLNSLESAIIKAEEDIKLLSDSGISIYDLMYNTLYSNGHIYVIDTLDYGERPISYEENKKGLNREIKLFLVDNYFNNFIDNNIILKKMYLSSNVSGVEFIKEFRKQVSEYLGEEIVTLNRAKSLVKKTKKEQYIRDIR